MLICFGFVWLFNPFIEFCGILSIFKEETHSPLWGFLSFSLTGFRLLDFSSSLFLCWTFASNWAVSLFLNFISFSILLQHHQEAHPASVSAFYSEILSFRFENDDRLRLETAPTARLAILRCFFVVVFPVQCLPLRGHGFVLDKYQCHCKKGFYHPSRVAVNSFTSKSQSACSACFKFK